MHHARGYPHGVALALVAAVITACGSSTGARPSARQALPLSTAAPSAFATVAAATPSATATAAAVADAAATVVVSGMRFSPDAVHVKAGSNVVWRFDDGGVPHTVTAFDRSFDSGVLTQGTFTMQFDTPGTYCYQCLLHPGLNLCAQAAPATQGQLQLLSASANGVGHHLGSTGVEPAFLGGGGHMQGKIVVEP